MAVSVFGNKLQPSYSNSMFLTQIYAVPFTCEHFYACIFYVCIVLWGGLDLRDLSVLDQNRNKPTHTYSHVKKKKIGHLMKT